jgi:hypothetical protein
MSRTLVVSDYRPICRLLLCMAVLLRPTFLPGQVSEASPLPPSVGPDLNADPAVDVGAMDRYEAAIRQMLDQRKFDQLDDLATSLRTHKTRFAGGVWKLYVFYRGLKQPSAGRQADDKQWEAHLMNLEEWTDRNPDSVTAWIALAEAFYEYSEKSVALARSSPETDTKEAEDARWAMVDDAVHAAKLALLRASKLRTKCPEFYLVKQKIAGKPDDDLLREAQAFEPEYYYYYRMHALFLQISHDVEPDAAEKFADAISVQIGGEQGAIVYYEVAAALNGGVASGLRPKANLAWDRVQRGYAILERQYGQSVFKANQMAFLAVQERDMAAAKPLFALIGDRWDRETWGTRDFFEYARVRAMPPAEISSLLEVADANQKTSQGRQYYQIFSNEIPKNYASTYARCAEPLGDNLGGSFDLLFKIGKNGEIQKVKAWPLTKLSTCLASAKTNGRVTPPPSPSFWLRIPWLRIPFQSQY